ADDEIGRLPAGHYVRIAVSDTGSGIPSEIVGRVIEPFFTTKPVGEGTGLGLSQVYGLVQESKGELKIDSIPEESTTIAMYLPAHSLAAQAEPGSEKKARVGRALIVDDQSEVLTATVQLFRIMEFDVLSASSGTDALRILQHRPDIDLLFTDVIMPGMNGVSLAIEARKINPDIEVLLASGYPGEALVNQGHDAASFTLIRKPYSLLELVQNLGRFMNEESSARIWVRSHGPETEKAGPTGGRPFFEHGRAYRSKRSSVITLVQAATKSSTNFSSPSWVAYTSATARSSELEAKIRSTGVAVHFSSPLA